MMNNLVLALAAVLVNLVLSVVVLTLVESKTLSVDLLKATAMTNKNALLVSCAVSGVLVLMSLQSFPKGAAPSWGNVSTNMPWRHM
jgi:hypothetical protein